MPDGSLSLHDGVAVLKKHYGSPAPLPTADPFELILWENAPYLASPRRRHEAFEQLRSTIGIKNADLRDVRVEFELHPLEEHRVIDVALGMIPP